MVLFRDFLYVEELCPDYDPEVEDEGCFQKLFQIPSGELLYHNNNGRDDYKGVKLDLGEDFVHLVRHGDQFDQVAIVAFNSRDHSPILIDKFRWTTKAPHFFFDAQFRSCAMRIIYEKS